MSLFKSRRQNMVLVGTTSFRYSRDAKEYFGEKYGFVGEQLQKLCADTGLMSVVAKVDTGGVVQGNIRLPLRKGLQKARLHQNRGDLERMEGDRG